MQAVNEARHVLGVVDVRDGRVIILYIRSATCHPNIWKTDVLHGHDEPGDIVRVLE